MCPRRTNEPDPFPLLLPLLRTHKRRPLRRRWSRISSDKLDTLRFTLELLRRIPRRRNGTASQLRDQFVRPADFDFDRFDDEGRLAFGEGSRVQLSFRIDAKAGAHLRETPLSSDQTVEEDGKTLKITATVTDSLLLKRWLQGFGSEVTDLRRKPCARGLAEVIGPE